MSAFRRGDRICSKRFGDERVVSGVNREGVQVRTVDGRSSATLRDPAEWEPVSLFSERSA